MEDHEIASRGMKMAPSSHAHNLLLILLRSDIDAEALRRIDGIIERTLDWDYILRCAQRSHVAPQVYHSLKTIGRSEAVPPSVWREFELSYRKTGIRNTLRYEELKKVLRSFEEAGIRTLILKGAALAQEVWGNVALRDMADIDLLVREEDLEKADTVLIESGYGYYEGYRAKEWYEENHHHLAPYNNPAKSMVIEVHRNIVKPNGLFRINADELWERANPMSFGDIDTETLSPEDTIIHLCLHLSYDGNFVGNIRALADICRVIEKFGDRINWDWLVEEAQRNEFARFMYYPLFLAADSMNAQIGMDVLESLGCAANFRTLRDRLLKKIIKEAVVSGDEPSSIIPEWFVSRLCRVLLHEDHLPQRLLSLMKPLLLPPMRSNDDGSSPQTPGIVLLYYPFYRLFKILLKLAGMMIRRISHRVGATAAS